MVWFFLAELPDGGAPPGRIRILCCPDVLALACGGVPLRGSTLAYGKAARTAGLFPGMFRNGFAAQTVFSFLFLSDAVYDYSSTLSVFIRSLPAILHFLFPDF